MTPTSTTQTSERTEVRTDASDPLKARAKVFVRRRRLHAHRLWLKTIAAARGTDQPPSRPVFVVGCPRSGTTLLFRLLRRHPELSAPLGEGHVLWSTYQHPRDKGWASDRATAEDIKEGEARYLYTGIRSFAGEARFLDKTPRNVLKIPYLASLFPGASFVLLKREARATVNSLIEGWEVRHGVSYRLPQQLDLAEYRGDRWSYVLPPGWRQVAGTSFADVAALQYRASYETALDDLARLPSGSVTCLKFEQLLEDPIGTMGTLLDRLELERVAEVMEMAGNLEAHPVQTNSPPRPEKWRAREDQILRIMPAVAPTMSRLGYEVG